MTLIAIGTTCEVYKSCVEILRLMCGAKLSHYSGRSCSLKFFCSGVDQDPPKLSFKKSLYFPRPAIPYSMCGLV